MAKMTLGGVEFDYNPSSLSEMVVKDKISASVKTYSSVAFFSWGCTIIGKEITLSWDAMTSTQYDTLQTLYESDVPLIFAPKDDGCNTLTVEITDLRGVYMSSLTGDNVWRKDVSMTLLILDEGN